MKEKIKIKGRLKAVDESGQVLYDSDNMILREGYLEVTRLFAQDLGGTKFGWITIGDGQHQDYDYDDIDDIEGNALHTFETTNETFTYEEEPGQGIGVRMYGTTESTGSQEIHTEGVLANGDTVGDRVCFSYIDMGEGIVQEAGKTITYIWEITVYVV